MFPKNDQILTESTYKIKYKSQGVPGVPIKYPNTAQTMSSDVSGCLKYTSGVSRNTLQKKTLQNRKHFFELNRPSWEQSCGAFNLWTSNGSIKMGKVPKSTLSMREKEL